MMVNNLWLVVENHGILNDFPIIFGISSSQLTFTPSIFRGVGIPPARFYKHEATEGYNALSLRPRSSINIIFTWARSVQVKINTEHILVALLFILLFADPCLLSTICSSAVSLNVICTIRLRAHHASSTGLISVFFSQQQPKEVPASRHNAPDGTANEGPHVFLQTPQYVLLHTQYITIYVLTISTWYTC